MELVLGLFFTLSSPDLVTSISKEFSQAVTKQSYSRGDVQRVIELF